jgi:hypothetical protein
MSNSKFISGMVMYTISEKELRDYIRKSITDKNNDFDAEFLDQSTYAISCSGKILSVILDKLKSICEKAKKETGKDFLKTNKEEENDFVAFYHATNSDYKENRDKIQRIPIV